MNGKRKISNRTVVLTAVIGSLLIAAMMSANTLWSSRRNSAATNEAVSAVSSFFLEAMADRGAKTITNLIGSDFEQMEKAVAYIADEKYIRAAWEEMGSDYIHGKLGITDGELEAFRKKILE